MSASAPRSSCRRRLGREIRDEQVDARIARARGRIALPHDARARRLDLEALDLGDRRLVDARERDVALVGRPPVAGVAVHLLLRDELGHAEAHEAAAFARDRALLAGREVDDVEILVAHEAHVMRARREARVGLVALGAREPAHGLAGLARQVVDVQVAVRAESAAGGCRARSCIRRCRRAPRCAGARGAPLPRRTARARRRRACASPRAAGARAWRDVEGPEIEAILVVVARAQVGDELAVGRNLDAAQGRARRGPARRTGARAAVSRRCTALAAPPECSASARALRRARRNRGAPDRRARPFVTLPRKIHRGV